jgi:group I intron endonuclease
MSSNNIYHTIYETKNPINGKIYRGKHSTTNPYDEYLGSGTMLKKAFLKYGKENFKKEVLYIFESEQDAFNMERILVDAEFVSREDTYNLTVGGDGFSSGIDNPCYGRTGESHPMFGGTHTDEARKKISNSNTGLQRSNETKARLSDSKTGEKNPMFGKTGESAPMFGKTHTDAIKDKLRKLAAQRFHTEESKTKRSEAMVGRLWWHCDELQKNILVKEEDLDTSHVWIRGREKY